MRVACPRPGPRRSLVHIVCTYIPPAAHSRLLVTVLSATTRENGFGYRMTTPFKPHPFLSTSACAWVGPARTIWASLARVGRREEGGRGGKEGEWRKGGWGEGESNRTGKMTALGEGMGGRRAANSHPTNFAYATNA